MNKLRKLGIPLLILSGLVVLNIILKSVWASHWQNRDIPLLAEDSISKHPLRHVQANGLDFAYIEKGQGPLVILVHGFPDSAETWDETIDVLAASGFRAVAFFQRGYFPTEIPADGNYSVLSQGQDIVALIDALSPGNPQASAYVVGHDWGASASYAAANLAPEKVRKLVTLAIPHPRIIKPSPALFWRASHFILFQFGWFSRWYAAKNNFEYIDYLYSYWSPTWDIPPRQSELIKKMYSQPGRLDAAIGYYEFLFKATDEENELRRRITSVPTLTFAGENDGAFDTINGFNDMPTAFSAGYEFVLIKAAGHFLHREKHDEFATKLISFLRQ